MEQGGQGGRSRGTRKDGPDSQMHFRENTGTTYKLKGDFREEQRRAADAFQGKEVNWRYRAGLFYFKIGREKKKTGTGCGRGAALSWAPFSGPGRAVGGAASLAPRPRLWLPAPVSAPCSRLPLPPALGLHGKSALGSSALLDSHLLDPASAWTFKLKLLIVSPQTRLSPVLPLLVVGTPVSSCSCRLRPCSLSPTLTSPTYPEAGIFH